MLTIKFQRSKIGLPLSALLLIITACSQPPNYAPVKTVNQAVEPENGDEQDHRPIKPSSRLKKPQKKSKTLYEGKTAKSNRQNPATRPSQARELGQNPYTDNSKVQPGEKGTNNHNSDLNYAKQPTLPLGNLAKKSAKTKTDYPDSGSYPTTTSKKPTKLVQKTTEQVKNKQAISSTNETSTQKNQISNTKLLDNIQITEKNIKKSIISIDNKKVLKLSFQWPLQGRVSRNFSQTDNKGILILGKAGQTVYAAESGKAVYCGQGLAGFGNLAIIKHNEIYLSAYANNSKLMIKEGQKVGKGQAIGQVGRTGLKKASLHFEIRKNGKPINPLTVLPTH